jgi:hypothetical protein
MPKSKYILREPKCKKVYFFFLMNGNGEQVARKKKQKISMKLVKKRKEEYHSSSESSVGSDGSEGEASDTDKESLSGSDKEEIDSEMAEQEKVQVQEAKSKKMKSVISKILAQNQPILSKKRKLETEIDEQKLEQKAKKLITSQRKLKREVGRVKPGPETLSYEKTLRKVATRGVIQLFNALRQVQKEVKELNEDGIQKHAAEVPLVSKSVFLKALKEPSNEQKVSFLKDDFVLKTTKHWDEED